MKAAAAALGQIGVKRALEPLTVLLDSRIVEDRQSAAAVAEPFPFDHIVLSLSADAVLWAEERPHIKPG